MICIYTRLHAFASLSGGVFSLFSPLNIYISLFFCLSDLFLIPSLLLVLLPVSSSAPQARGHPCPSLLPPFLPSLRLSSAPPAPAVCLLWWLPSLVSYQAQNAMTVGADAPCICPRPDLLLPMCCRVSRCSFRGFRPSVSVCVLLPCVVRRQ